MSGFPNLLRRRYATQCTVTVLHTDETLEAHVELDGARQPDAGDRVVVHGAPVQVPYGETIVFQRPASITIGSLFDKAWVRLKSLFLLTELYEVSFSTGRLK